MRIALAAPVVELVVALDWYAIAVVLLLYYCCAGTHVALERYCA